MVAAKLHKPKEQVEVMKMYVKQKLIGKLEISEADLLLTTSDSASLTEVNEKQGFRRGQTNVTDRANDFFLSIFKVTSQYVTAQVLQKYGEGTHDYILNAVQCQGSLISEWFTLFSDIDCESMDFSDLHDCMLMEIFELVVEHFVKIHVSDFIKKFRSDNKDKKLALRAGINPKGSTKSKINAEKDEGYKCGVCNMPCVDEPPTAAEASIGCDTCDKWFHYPCVNLTGS